MLFELLRAALQELQIAEDPQQQGAIGIARDETYSARNSQNNRCRAGNRGAHPIAPQCGEKPAHDSFSV